MRAEPTRILVYRLGSLGDTVVALPVFHALRARFPKASITLLTIEPNHPKAVSPFDLLHPAGLVDSVVAYPVGSRNLRSLLSLLAELRRRRFDLALHLAEERGRLSAWRDALFLWAAGIGKIKGVPLGFSRASAPGTGLSEPEASRLAQRVIPLVVPAVEEDVSWDLRFTSEEKEEAGRLLAPLGGIPFFAVGAGAKEQGKDWGEENWLRFVRELSLRMGGGKALVFVGASPDGERAVRCLREWPGPGLNLCGASLPRVSAAVLHRASAFFGHDGGPMHMAAAGGVPCMALFSSLASAGRWYPRGGERNRVLRAGEGEPIGSIPVGEAVSAALELAARLG